MRVRSYSIGYSLPYQYNMTHSHVAREQLIVVGALTTANMMPEDFKKCVQIAQMLSVDEPLNVQDFVSCMAAIDRINSHHRLVIPRFLVTYSSKAMDLFFEAVSEDRPKFREMSGITNFAEARKVFNDFCGARTWRKVNDAIYRESSLFETSLTGEGENARRANEADMFYEVMKFAESVLRKVREKIDDVEARKQHAREFERALETKGLLDVSAAIRNAMSLYGVSPTKMDKFLRDSIDNPTHLAVRSLWTTEDPTREA